jgi:hypothetical protein
MFDRVAQAKDALRTALEALEPEAVDGSAAAALVEDFAEI